MTKRRLPLPALAAATLCAISLGLPGCGDSADTAERVVVVYSAHGKDLLGDIESAFEAAHPGVDVIWQDMGADACYQRVRAERENPHADIWWGGTAYRFAAAADEDLLAPYQPTWAEQVPDHTHDPTWRWAGHFVMPQVIAFNRDTVGVVPEDWADLAKGGADGAKNVVLRDPGPSGGMKGILGAIFQAGPRLANPIPDPSAWFKGVADHTVAVTPNPAKLYDAIRRDTQGVVTVWNLTDILYQSEEATPPVPFGWIAPKSGVPMLPDGIALIARPGAQPSSDAIAFYEFVTGEVVAPLLANQHRRFLVREDLPRPEWAAKLELTAMDVDWAEVGRHVDTWQREWEDELSRAQDE